MQLQNEKLRVQLLNSFEFDFGQWFALKIVSPPQNTV
jgi:hypothetical protein